MCMQVISSWEFEWLLELIIQFMLVIISKNYFNAHTLCSVSSLEKECLNNLNLDSNAI